MGKIYKVLIVATFLISAFFFGKWTYKVWPRYKVIEKIDDYMIFTGWFAGDLCDNKKYLACFCQDKVNTTTRFLGGLPNIGEETCYTKEKVRVN